MAVWKEYKIGDLCDTISETYRGHDEEVILINTSDVLDGRILNHQKVPNRNVKGQFKKTFKTQDILYSEIRPENNRFAYVDMKDTSLYIASTKLMVIRANIEIIEPRFLYAILTAKSMTQELQARAELRSGTFPQITFKTELATINVYVPDKNTQKKIVSFLDAINRKIEVNNKINRNLSEQAQAYFDELFIQNASAEWKEGTLSDVGSIVAGGTPFKSNQEYYTDNGIAWITPKDLSVDKSVFISHGENDITELGLQKSSATMMPAGTVLFSSRAPIGYIAIAANDICTNQGFKSVVPNGNVGTSYVYYLLKQLLPTIENMASGSTFKEISGSAMKIVPTVIPDDETLKRFSDFCDPIMKQIWKNEQESKRLVELRDSLLPKLMSGDLDVSDLDI